MSLMIRFSIGKGPGIELLMCYYDNQVSSDTRGRGGARVKIKKKCSLPRGGTGKLGTIVKTNIAQWRKF